MQFNLVNNKEMLVHWGPGWSGCLAVSLLHGGSGRIEKKLVSDYCCRHFYSGPVNEKKHETAYSFISTTYPSAARYTACVDQRFPHVSLFYSWL